MTTALIIENLQQDERRDGEQKEASSQEQISSTHRSCGSDLDNVWGDSRDWDCSTGREVLTGDRCPGE